MPEAATPCPPLDSLRRLLGESVRCDRVDWRSVTAVVTDAASLLLASLLGHFVEATDRANAPFSTPEGRPKAIHSLGTSRSLLSHPRVPQVSALLRQSQVTFTALRF